MNKFILHIAFFCGIFLTGCSGQPETFTEIDRQAAIFPNYTDTWIPYNIAPLNFRINENAEKFHVRFVVAGKDLFYINTKETVDIPVKKWKNLLTHYKGEEVKIKIFGFENKQWKKFNDFTFQIAEEAIDPYIAYRLIEPGYELWNEMGIYQRCLENFEETPVLLNTQTEGNCMNCHSFCDYDPERMLFHMRSQLAGTMLVKDGRVEKVSTKLPSTLSEGVYPRWHPAGRYVAFSTNYTVQGFMTAHTNKVEVFDKNSDIILYDTETHTVLRYKSLNDENRFETFPEWSPDGKHLYFCSAQATEMPKEFRTIKYDLLRIAFNTATGQFSNQVDTIVSSYETGKSCAFPRVSPDGKQLVVCMFDFGTFPIWHRENDLYSIDLITRQINSLDKINSPESDSYHTWSSNGRWLIFSSRRMDGSFTRPFISYVDKNGDFQTPFVLPQKNPEFYNYFLKSYNIPEFIKGKISVSPQQLSKAARQTPITPQGK